MDILDREFERCLEFYFTAKNDFIKTLLATELRGKRLILNIGCGEGGDLDVIGMYGDVISLDISYKAIKSLDPKKSEKIVGDSVALPFRSKKFDSVMMFDVLEHIEDDKEAIGEVLRVLKRGGKFIIIVPACRALFSSHDAFLKHFRRYNKSELVYKLGKFKIRRVGYWNSLLFLPITIMRFGGGRGGKSPNPKTLPSPFVNMLEYILRAESLLAKNKIGMPFGLSIFCVAEKT
jgi:SAM-dependent methyltransferase